MSVIPIVLALALDDVDDLVERLGHRSIDAREEATAALVARGRRIEARLRRVTSDDPEVEGRLEIILDELAYQIEAAAVRIEVSSRGWTVTPVRAARAEPLERVGDRFVCTISGGVRYDARRPHELLLATLRRDIARPFDLDLPAALDLLASVRGFADLVPALEDRARKTSDPAVKSVCERAIRFQKEDP